MSDKVFPEVPGGYPFPELEVEILAEWRDRKIFARTLEQTRDGKKFVFYEGPPTANNAPHVGHVVTRVVKDLFPRYRTMRGQHVPRKAGWDTHGLPVEIEVEKRLGFTGKQQIEEYGIPEFNRACLESVGAYERQWRAMSERVGYWMDFDGAYFTYSNRYIESVWWALRRLWRRALLEQDYKIQPYCARCGTTLSSHEVAQNYREVDDPSIWVLFPVRPGQRLVPLGGGEWTTSDGLKLVAWTTTPWTVLAHVGLAAHPDATYVVVEHPARPGEQFLFAEGLDNPVPCPVEDEEGKQELADLREQPALARFPGRDLEGLRYDRPFESGPFDRSYEPGRFDPPPSDADGWCVLPGDYVTTSEGTGLVHTAPPFGEDDYRSGLEFRLPFILTVDSEGRVRADKEGIGAFAGRWAKAADTDIVRDLKDRGWLLHSDRYRHNYPFCWRCDSPLLYYPALSWFVRTTQPFYRYQLIDLNREIDWHPAHVGEGRFGDWLENVVDWALSRKRYWGTPLPVWRCDACPHTKVMGSFQELFQAAGKPLPEDVYDRDQFDPHRPFVDRNAEEPFVWPCPDCGAGTVGRVEEVIDAWFDSGAMPFAQHHYRGEAVPGFHPDASEGFPADFIAEAVDQTRGWFYTLHVLGVLLFGSVAYRTCIVLGHVNDEQGRKMSKRLGNVIEPMAVIAETGADALRWYFCVNNPEATSRFSARLVREAAQNFLLPLWNALSFFSIYANLDHWRPRPGRQLDFDARPPLDRWILLRLNRLVRETTTHLDGFRIAEAARGIEAFVDDLTNWYIRRSRDRFWAGTDAAGADKESAYRALYEVLTTLARVLAPFTPFLAELLHRHLVRSLGGKAAESVHLEPWPEAVPGRADEALEEGMAAGQRIVGLGHAARNSHGIKTRQPLPAVTVVAADPGLREAVEPYLDLVREELNVREVRWAEDRSAYVRHEIRPVFPRCGPRFGRRMPALQRALEEADGDRLAAELEERGRVEVEVAGEPVELAAEEVEVRLAEREGIATHGDRELLVALDTELTPGLIAEGWAREVVHRVQTARKEAKLDYADRIRVRYRAAPELEAAIEAHRDWIAGETLAVELTPVDGDEEELRAAPVADLDFGLAIEKVG